MEENHPYRSASGKVEIADVGCERMIIIKNYESLNYKWYIRRLAERKQNLSATRSRKKTTRHNKKGYNRYSN